MKTRQEIEDEIAACRPYVPTDAYAEGAVHALKWVLEDSAPNRWAIVNLTTQKLDSTFTGSYEGAVLMADQYERLTGQVFGVEARDA